MDEDCEDWFGGMVATAMEEMCDGANACVCVPQPRLDAVLGRLEIGDVLA